MDRLQDLIRVQPGLTHTHRIAAQLHHHSMAPQLLLTVAQMARHIVVPQPHPTAVQIPHRIVGPEAQAIRQNLIINIEVTRIAGKPAILV
ncbi:hypothetical protein GCM10028809_37490 [Spirosoma gilvum]